MDDSDLVKKFKALSEKKRIEILKLLADEEKCACVLLSHFSMTQSGLSYHMKILNDAGIVNSRQEGKWTYYSVNKDFRHSMIEFIREISK